MDHIHPGTWGNQGTEGTNFLQTQMRNPAGYTYPLKAQLQIQF